MRDVFNHEPRATTLKNIFLKYAQVSTMFLKATEKKRISLEDDLESLQRE